jgi:Tol biopolymer transport system component
MLPIAALSLLIASVALAQGSGAPADGELIVFSRLDPRAEKVRLYTMRPDGRGVRPITLPRGGADGDSQSDWSPDGRQVAFRRFFNPGTENETTDVIVTSRRGGRARNVSRRSCTGRCLGSEEPAWSPDGSRIAFMRARGPFTDEGFPAVVGIFVMDADGSNVRQLTQLEPNSGTEDHLPTWSPDGGRIAFLRWNGTARPRGASAIWSVDAAGGGERLLRRMPPRRGGGGTPEWSPDGHRILFTTYCFFPDCGQPPTGGQLFTMDPDGGDLQRLTNVKGNAYKGGWSPNGSKIVFTRIRRAGAPSDVYSMNADGTGIRRLTRRKRPELFADYPDWGPALR